MQRGTVLNLRGLKKVFEVFSANSRLIILTLFFAFGFLAAVFTFGKNEEIVLMANNYIEEFISSRANVGFFALLVHSFLNSMLFLVLCFICGSSMLGVILVPLLVFLKGFVYGAVTAVLYFEYSLKGIAFHAVVIMPPAILFIIALILAAMEAIRFSLFLARQTLPQSVPTSLSLVFKRFCFKFLIFSSIVLMSALLDAFISCNFLPTFNL